MERVREIRADEQVDDAQVAAARTALLREITRAERAPVRRRRTAWIGAGGLVAACTVGAVVAGSVLSPAGSPPAAAAVFEKAAEIAVTGVAFDVPSGKYLRITSSGEGIVFWDSDMPDEISRFNNGQAADAEAALQVRQSRQLYVPSDQSEDWMMVAGPEELVATYGSDAAQAASEYALTRGEELVAPGGVYSSPEDAAGSGQIQDIDGRGSWGDEPMDPEDLLHSLRLSMGAADADSSESDSSIVETLTERLTDGAAPAERRASWLRVLGLLDGSSIESVNGDVTTVRFSWSTEWWTAWTLLDIDTARGLVLGVTSSPAITGEESALGGLPQWRTRQQYTYEVVDFAPRP
jgi:hypothetical protein